MLMALYVWYEGKNLMENFGLQVRQIYTDKNIGDVQLEEDFTDLAGEDVLTLDEDTQKQLEFIRGANTKTYSEWVKEEEQKDLEALKRILSTKVGREAYQKQFDEDPDSLVQRTALYTIPDEIFYNTEQGQKSDLQKQFDSITNLR